MNKTNTILISILLVLAAIVIQILTKNSVSEMEIELSGFLSGFCFAGGIFLFFSTFFKKKV